MSSSEDVVYTAQGIKVVGYCSRKTVFGIAVHCGIPVGLGNKRVEEHNREMFRDSMAPEEIHLSCSCQLL